MASLFAASIEGFIEVAEVLSETGADALEVNVSCPNVEEEMGMLGADCLNTERVTAAVRDVAKQPVFVKLSPNVTDITSIAISAEKGGADAITAVNTLKGMAINAEIRRPILSNITGGLSGSALKPIALRCVWEIAESVEIPVIGCGGISNWRDAIEFFLAGASAIEIGTAVMEQGFCIYKNIVEGMKVYLTTHGFSDIEEIIGLAQKAVI